MKAQSNTAVQLRRLAIGIALVSALATAACSPKPAPEAADSGAAPEETAHDDLPPADKTAAQDSAAAIAAAMAASPEATDAPQQ